MKPNLFLTLLFAASLFYAPAHAQGLAGKLKQKAAQAAEKALEKKASDKISGSDNNSEDTSNSGVPDNTQGKNRPQNKGGGGLKTTPPDVNKNLGEAEGAYKSKSYGEARYAIQQAMLGVEMEIGQQVLKSLPETVSGLPKDASADQVTSTGWGWAGLTIQREYTSDDKQLRTTIANNSAMIASVNMYLSNPGYAQSTGGEQNWKQTKVKGHRAIIEYDESTGYKLSVPLGQSSIIIWEGVNFQDEAEMTKAAETFDIDGIKKMFGEQ